MAPCINPLPQPMLTYCQLDPMEQTQLNINQSMGVLFQENAFQIVICEMVPFHSDLNVLIKLCYREVGRLTTYWFLNSLAPGRSENNFEYVIFKPILQINIFSTSYKIALMWMPQSPIHAKSTLVQVMAWCRQATSHYLNQCWPRFVTTYHR